MSATVQPARATWQDRALTFRTPDRVPDVWRVEGEAWAVGFSLRGEDGNYTESPRSPAFPMLTAAEILAQLRLSDQLGSARWFRQLRGWVEETLVPRLGERH